jgi:hypothetical protein
MKRKKWFIIPFVINLFAIVLTQLTVPVYDFVVEANPVNNFFYQSFGSFIFAPFLTLFILFLVLPSGVEFFISKTADGEKYRKHMEWAVILCACSIFSADLINNIIVFLSI